MKLHNSNFARFLSIWTAATICNPIAFGAAVESELGVAPLASLKTALQCTMKYDIFSRPVLIQTIYTPQLEESIVFMPVVSGTMKTWRAEVTFPRRGQTRITVSNLLPVGAGDKSALPLLNRVVARSLVAIKSSSIRGKPFTVNVVLTSKKNYWVIYTPLPEVPDGVAIVEVSHDLKTARSMP